MILKNVLRGYPLNRLVGVLILPINIGRAKTSNRGGWECTFFLSPNDMIFLYYSLHLII